MFIKQIITLSYLECFDQMCQSEADPAVLVLGKFSVNFDNISFLVVGSLNFGRKFNFLLCQSSTANVTNQRFVLAAPNLIVYKQCKYTPCLSLNSPAVSCQTAFRRFYVVASILFLKVL